MLRKKALRKIFVTTMSIFIIVAIYFIPTASTPEKTLRTNLELEYITGLGNHSIYLLDQNNYLVKTKILLDTTDVVENAKTILTNLTISSSTKFPERLHPVIPKGTKVLSVMESDNTLTVNFSDDILKIEADLEQKMIEAIVYSLTELSNIKAVKIEVEGEPLTKYPQSKEPLSDILTRDIGINKRYDLTSTKDINKVVIYYVESVDDGAYYVPVTKYVNDSRDKIDIIIEELTTGYIYEPNLMSLINEDTKLTDYRQEDDLFILNFNDALFDSQGEIKEEVLYTIGYCIFDNYDVTVASIRVNDQEVTNIKRSQLP